MTLSLFTLFLIGVLIFSVCFRHAWWMVKTGSEGDAFSVSLGVAMVLYLALAGAAVSADYPPS